MQYINEMAKQLNGPIIHSLLETRHNIYNEAETFINHRQHLSLQNATEQELEYIGKFLGIPRPYAIVEGETVECSVEFYRMFLENVMFLRTTRSILDLQQMMDQFMPDGLFLLKFIKEGAYKGDIQLTIDAQYAEYKPFFQIAVDAIYNTLPKIHLEEPWDFEEIVLNHILYSHVASLIDGAWNSYVTKQTIPYSFVFNALRIVIQGGVDWTAKTSGVPYYLDSVTYGDGLFVAVGDDGTAFTSPDAINWTTRHVNISGNLRFVTYGNGLFVAVWYPGLSILTSPDAINWTVRTSGINIYLNSVTYGDGLYVAVGNSGTILTSPNAINWTSRASLTREPLRSVTYGNGLYVTVGDTGILRASTNAIDWMDWLVSGVTEDLYSVTYANGLFVAVGESGVIITSPDAVNWTVRTSGVSHTLYSVTYGDGLYVAVGNEGTVLTSPDAINWTVRTSGVYPGFYAVTYGDGLFVAVGYGGTVLTSPSGKISTFKSTYIDNSRRVWAMSAHYGLFLSTDNGATFTQQDTGIPTDSTVNCILQLNGTDIIVGTINGVYYSSDNGQNFVLRNDLPLDRVNAVFKDSVGHIWIGFNDSGVYRSINNGNTFTQQDTGVPTTNHVYCFMQTVDGTLYVGCSDSGGLYYSTNNGETFTQHSTQLSATCLLQDKDGRIWLGNSSGLHRSDDNGEYFTYSSYLPNGVGCSCIHQRSNGDLWFGTYLQNGVYKSTNGETLSKYTNGIPSDTSVNDITEDFLGELYIATIDNGLYKSKETLEFVKSICVVDYTADKISVADHKVTTIIRRQ